MGFNFCYIKESILPLNMIVLFTLKINNITPVTGWFMVFNVTFNNISVILWLLVLLVEETRVSGENHRPVASH
jgi:hypothetical protein